MTLRCKLFNLIQCVGGIKMWISCYNLLLLLVLLLSTRSQNPHKIFWCHVQIHNWINSYAKRATNLSHNLFCSVLDSFFSLFTCTAVLCIWMEFRAGACTHCFLASFVYKFTTENSIFTHSISRCFYRRFCAWYLPTSMGVCVTENILHFATFERIEIFLVYSFVRPFQYVELGTGFAGIHKIKWKTIRTHIQGESTLNTEHPRWCRDYPFSLLRCYGCCCYCSHYAYTQWKNHCLTRYCRCCCCCCCGCLYNTAVFHNFVQ